MEVTTFQRLARFHCRALTLTVLSQLTVNVLSAYMVCVVWSCSQRTTVDQSVLLEYCISYLQDTMQV